MGATEEYFAMAYEADNNHNFKQISIASSSLQYKEYKSTTDIKTWTKTAAKKEIKELQDHMVGIFHLR